MGWFDNDRKSQMVTVIDYISVRQEIDKYFKNALGSLINVFIQLDEYRDQITYSPYLYGRFQTVRIFTLNNNINFYITTKYIYKEKYSF